MVQTGGLTASFLIPLTTFFLMRFWNASRIHQQGLYLCTASFLFAVSLQIYIPIWIIFYFLIFSTGVFLFKIVEIKRILQFIRHKHGVLWISASLLIIVLLSSPVIALYYELQYDTEHFPTLRILQKNDYNLVKSYASDIQEQLFSEEFTNNLKISLTFGNLLGLLFEPFQYHILFTRHAISEAVLYIGFLPLLCVGVAVIKVRNRYTYCFSAIAVLVLLIACNFGRQVFSQPGLNQQIMLMLFPFLNMADVLQAGGSLFVFCLVILGAIGFQRIIKEKPKILWLLPIFFPLYKYIVLSPLILGGQFHIYQQKSILYILGALALLLFIQPKNFITNRLYNISLKGLQQFSIVILFLSLVTFDVFHILYPFPATKALDSRYYDYFQHENLLYSSPESHFINYRTPFSFSSWNPTEVEALPLQPFDEESLFLTFFGHEIYKEKKVAFPNVVKRIRSQITGETFLALLDHMFMTTHYYDYLVNVPLEKQLVMSNIITPIINFFPKDHVIFARDKYQVVERINNASIEELRTHIYLEQDRNLHRPDSDVSKFFDPAYFLEYTRAEITSFDRQTGLIYPPNPNVSLKISAYDVNHLSLHVDTPYAGYLYFGDGYSKHWKAWIDGKEAKIEKTNINFKAVYTPAGKHRVEFRYDPILFRYSIYLYAIGNILFLSMLTASIRKRHKHPI